MIFLGSMFTVLLLVLAFASRWMIYKKMGKEGWEFLVPGYNLYVICESLYGNGWKFLFILIPLYNIYFVVKLIFDFAKAFNKNVGYALGLIFVSDLFIIMLGLGKAVFKDGEAANTNEDLVTRAIDACKKHENAPVKDEKAVEKLEKLNDLKKAGLMTEEEFEQKRKELIERI